MSQPIYDIDEANWDRYLVDCQLLGLRPDVSDYLVWCDEMDIDRPEIYDGDFGDE